MSRSWQDFVFIAVVWSVLLTLFYISYRLLQYGFPHMRKFSRRYLAVAVCLTIVFVLWLNFLAPPGLPLSFARSPVSGNHKFVLFNPFRDRRSEQAAQRFFDIIKSGDCGDFNSLAQGVPLPNNLTCEELHEIVSDSNHKGVLDQRLRDRVDKGSLTWLWFSDDGYGGNQVILEKRGERWHVVGFWKVW
jgi:hypothetical protein